jgi:Ca2+-binding RTX toxin-like protein
VDTGTTDHVYTAEERAAIEARMEALYHGPDTNPVNWWFQVVFTQSASEAAALSGTDGYATIWFNRPRVDPDGSEQPGGEASEVDFRNQSLVGESVIQINGLLGGPGQAADTSVNWVMASANVAAHELAHLMGVRHADAYGPIGYGIHNPPGATVYTPIYPGPAGAFETNDHLITSPASTGSTVADIVNDLFFGEREAIRLAMAFYAPQEPQAGTVVVAETAGDHSTTASAQPLALVGLNVPNTLGQGLNVNKQFSVAAVDVVGSMTSATEVDVYSFQGRAGDLINLEVISDGVIRTGQTTHAINAVLEILNASGQILAYYDPDLAVTDDEFESFDAQIIDLRLPSDGTYFVKLTTRAVDSDGNPLTITPETPGVYELFLYRFKAYNPIDGGDVLSGAEGNDMLDGGLGDDTVRGGLGVDVLTGGSGHDTAIGADTTNLWLLGSADAGTVNQSSFAGFEQLNGGALDDTFVLANGATITATINGGAGTNTLDYSAWTTSVSVNLATGAATGLVSSVLGHNFQNVIGGSGNDTLVGDDLDNVFTGNGGSDTMNGGLGNDTFVFTSSSTSETDVITGGGGMDTLDFTTRTAGVTLDLGKVGNTQSVGGGLVVVLQAADMENVYGSLVGDNDLTGNALDNLLVGGAGNDELNGSSGNDVLLGGAGDDLLVGSSGNDVLIGGFGQDVLSGGFGNDLIVTSEFADGNDPATLIDDGVSDLVLSLFGNDEVFANDDDDVFW